MAGQKKIAKEGKQAHEKQRNGEITPKAKVVPTAAPRQTMMCVSSSQHPLSSHFCQPQSKQSNRFVATT